MNWEKITATYASFPGTWGIRCVCQSCGTRQKVRLTRGVKVSNTTCVNCRKHTLKKAKIDDEGNVLNDPLTVVSKTSEAK